MYNFGKTKFFSISLLGFLCSSFGSKRKQLCLRDPWLRWHRFGSRYAHRSGRYQEKEWKASSPSGIFINFILPHSFSKNPLKYYFSREIPLTILNSLVCITLKRKEKIITLNEYLGEEQFGIVIKCFHVTKMMMVIRFDSLIHVPAV